MKEGRLVIVGGLAWCAVILAPLLLLACGASVEQQRAVTVAECMVRVVADVPPGALLLRDPVDYTLDELILAAAVVDGLRACRAPLPTGDAPTGDIPTGDAGS